MSVVVAFPVLAAAADPAVIWRDMVLNPTPTPGSASPLAMDVAPAAGPEIAILVVIAAVVIGVVLVVARARRRRP